MLPLPGVDPSGIDLKFSDLVARIEEERKEDDAELQAKLQNDGRFKAKKANFAQVVSLAEDAIATKSKDLWLGAWLCDALIHEGDLAGLRQGLEIIHRLLEQYWDSLYPKLDGEDPWPRLAPLNWLGDYCNAANGSSPILVLRMLSVGGSLKNSQHSTSEDRKEHLRSVLQDAKTSQATLAAIDKFCQQKFLDEPPSFSVLAREIDKISVSTQALLEAELSAHPDSAPKSTETHRPPDLISKPVNDLTPLSYHTPASNGTLKTADEAIQHVTTSSRFLQRINPSNPVPYLLIRALRWGELRGVEQARFASLLEPPSSDLRIAVKRHAMEGSWQLLLDTAEAAMCTACGRAWLDLQRYAIVACENLGYEIVAQTLRSELRQLLSDLPQLATATLLDDTGAANPETAAWLRTEGLTG